jgi:hypothetical protein
VELLFFEDVFLLQSRWVSEEGDQASSIREAIRASSASLEREWRRRPNQVLLLGGGSEPESALVPDSSLQVEKVSIGADTGSELPSLLTGAADVYLSGQAFDFTLPIVKESREKERRARKFTKLAASAACFALSILFFASVQAALTLAKTSWFRIQIGVLNQSVKEVKTLREQTLLVRDYQQKKLVPLKLLAIFRKLIPGELLLDELEYSVSQSLVRIGGKAPEQSQVDKFVASLEKDPIFEKLWLEGVQAERDKQGKSVYHFSLQGVLKLNS